MFRRGDHETHVILAAAIVAGLAGTVAVLNVTAIVTLNKEELGRAVGAVPESIMRDVDKGLRQVLAL